VLEEGFFFGEIGVLVTGTRTASVRAKTSCLFYSIEKDSLLEILNRHPTPTRVLLAIASQRHQAGEQKSQRQDGEEVKDTL